MRPIKFRGKGRRTGNWFYGNLYIDMYGRTHIFSLEVGGIEVEPETVGQFTGLYDCDGKEIFEGDVLKWSNGRMYVVKFREGMFYASIEKSNEDELGGFPLLVLTNCEYEKPEIAGNIIDNPELLKGGEEREELKPSLF